jgi:cysteine-rich repeat protein
MNKLIAFLLCSLLPTMAWAQVTANTTQRPLCGNRVIEGREQCDDGNFNSDDGCSSICIIESPKDPLIGAAVSVAGMLFAPVVGGSIGYLYSGDRARFRRAAGIQVLAGIIKITGTVLIFVDLSQDAADFANDDTSDFGFSPLGLTLVGVGGVTSIVVDISSIIGSVDSVNQHNQNIMQYQGGKPTISTKPRSLEGLALAPTPLLAPSGVLVPGAALSFRW